MDISKVKDVMPHITMGMGMAFGGVATVGGIIGTFELTEDGYGRKYICDKSVPLKKKAEIIGKYYGLKVGLPTILATGCFMTSMHGYSAQVANAVSVAAWYKKHLKEYREKNRELYGEENDRSVEDAIIREHISQNPPPKRKNSDAFLIYDPITDQYFEATQKEIDHCEREMNRILGKESGVEYWFLLKHFKNAKYNLPICSDIGWFLDESYADYHYWNESFYARELFEINLERLDDAPEGDVYILRCSIEPMLNMELDADVVKDSQDLQGI
jgi:hypothetical protein